MKNNTLIIILGLIIAVFLGVSLMYGISNAITVSMSPLTAEIGGIKAIQGEMQKELSSDKKTDLAVQLALLNQRLMSIEVKINNMQSAPSGFNRQQAPTGQGGGCGGGGEAPSADFNKVYTIDAGISPVAGKRNAPVTITAFLDLQCPFCARFYPVLDDVLKAYPDKVKVVVKNFPLPFHPNALPAAKLALAANEQGKYFETIELLMQNGGAVTDDKIKDYAKKLGLNYKKLMNDYKNKDSQWEKQINDDQNLANQVSVHGTPTFYINGRLTHARDLESYKAEIDKILADKK